VNDGPSPGLRGGLTVAVLEPSIDPDGYAPGMLEQAASVATMSATATSLNMMRILEWGRIPVRTIAL
jgi:hypothetical protein